ncbi:MAG: peptidylprolyl isomerase [Planctomycetes bacterium]|nr:peptidylprolyl isomerase [Planctomycetota bacterium]
MCKLTLLPFLLLAACTAEAEHVASDENGANVTEANNLQPEDPVTSARAVSDEEVEAVMKDGGVISGDRPLIAAPGSQEPKYEPKRAPEHGFQVGGDVSNEALANYYVDITIAIDGEEVGTMSIALWPQFAPGTVRNFLRYADEGFYDGLAYHRILREFMCQGGDSKGDGSGDGPHGNIVGEFQKPGEEARKHAYGVLSMARSGSPNSASSQFFICCAETPDVWNLDGAYASFGKLTKGVDVLEAMANVPVGGPRRSSPMRKVVMTRVEVKEGVPPVGERPIERPKPDLGGEPEFVTVQHILVSFEGAQRNVAKKPRTAAEADALVKDLMGRIEKGEDFNALVIENSDDNFAPDEESPSIYPMINFGVQQTDRLRAEFSLQPAATAMQQDVAARQRAGQITAEEARDEVNAWVREKIAELDDKFGERALPRDQMAGAFGDVGFKLQVGEVGLAKPDAQNSPFGYHIIKRIK